MSDGIQLQEPQPLEITADDVLHELVLRWEETHEPIYYRAVTAIEGLTSLRDVLTKQFADATVNGLITVESPFSPDIEPLDAPGIRYRVAADGLYLERKTADYRAVTKADEIPFLSAGPDVRLWPSFVLPDDLLRRVLGFLYAAERRYGTEAGLIILRHPEYGFELYCPQQTCSKSECDLKNPLALPHGWTRFGDVHLHPACYGPQPSIQDERDEKTLDGLHLIFSDLLDATKPPTHHAVFTLDGVRFTLRDSFLTVPSRDEWTWPPEEWLMRVTVETWQPWGGGKKQPPKTTTTQYGSYGNVGGVSKKSSYTGSKNYHWREDYRDATLELLDQIAIATAAGCDVFDPMVIEHAQKLCDEF